MREPRGRVQLIFRLDDPAEKAAFEILQAAPYRGKAAFVTRYILDKENEDRTAERIAAKIVEILSRQPTAVIQPPKRKRGRPPKQSQALIMSEAPVENPAKTWTARNTPKRKSVSVHTEPESALPPFTKTQEEYAPSSPMERPAPGQETKAEDNMLDDAILQSMLSELPAAIWIRSMEHCQAIM